MAAPADVCCSCLLQRALNSCRSPAERERGVLLLPACLVIGPIASLYCLTWCAEIFLTDGFCTVDGCYDRWVGVLALGLIGDSLMELLVRAWCGDGMPMERCGRCMLMCINGIMFLDFCMVLIAQHGTDINYVPVWQLTVLALDILLVINAEQNVSILACVNVAIFLVFRACYEGYRRSSTTTIVGAIAVTIGAGMLTIPVLVLDFYFTRGFASGLREQLRANEASVNVAEQVSVLLAGYRVEDASAVIDAHGHSLPSGMHVAFRALIGNLQAYKPFLPQSVLARGDEDRDKSSASDHASSSGTIGASHTSVSGSATQSTEVSQHLQLASPQALSQASPSSVSRGRRASSTDRTSRSYHRQDSPSSVVAPVPPAPAPAGTLRREPWRKNVALLAVNHHGFIAATCMEEDCRVQAWVKRMMMRCMEVVMEQKGILDIFCADHVDCSFGAVRSIGAPRQAAARAAVGVSRAASKDSLVANTAAFGGSAPPRRGGGDTSGVTRRAQSPARGQSPRRAQSPARGHSPRRAQSPACSPQAGAGKRAGTMRKRPAVASPIAGVTHVTELGALAHLRCSSAACYGNLLCGDFGSAARLRFMCLGGASSLVHVVERLASRWDDAALVDAAVNADLTVGWERRLRDRIVYHKRGSTEPLLLWQPREQQKAHVASEDECQEWMYELDEKPENTWSEYNDALLLWFAGHDDEAATAAHAVTDNAARAELRSRIMSGAARVGVVEEVTVSDGGEVRQVAPMEVTMSQHRQVAPMEVTMSQVAEKHRQEEEELSRARAEDARRQQAALDQRLRARRAHKAGAAGRAAEGGDMDTPDALAALAAASKAAELRGDGETVISSYRTPGGGPWRSTPAPGPDTGQSCNSAPGPPPAADPISGSLARTTQSCNPAPAGSREWKGGGIFSVGGVDAAGDSGAGQSPRGASPRAGSPRAGKSRIHAAACDATPGDGSASPRGGGIYSF